MLLSSLPTYICNTFMCIRVIFTPLSTKNPFLCLSLPFYFHHGNQGLYTHLKEWQIKANKEQGLTCAIYQTDIYYNIHQTNPCNLNLLSPAVYYKPSSSPSLSLLIVFTTHTQAVNFHSFTS